MYCRKVLNLYTIYGVLCKVDMTDQEYIVAFYANDQRAFAQFYNENRQRFMTAIGNKFAITDEYALASILTDACMRLWLNIRNEKLTVDLLHTPLPGYLYGIGERVALEYLHESSNQVSFEAIESVFADEPSMAMTTQHCCGRLQSAHWQR